MHLEIFYNIPIFKIKVLELKILRRLTGQVAELAACDIKAGIRDALTKTKGCRFELIMKDNNNICNEPNRVCEWVQIVREEIDRVY